MVRQVFRQAVDASHHGRPTLVLSCQTGRRGRPKLVIDEDFLRFAYAHQGTTAIARSLGCSPSTVRKAVLDYGIAEPGDDPFPLPPGPSDPLYGAQARESGSASSNTRVSAWTDNELDLAIRGYLIQFPNAGVSMLAGYLLIDHQSVPYERIRSSLARVDPVRRVFARITIVRRKYTVPGPNSLWHHDGQHGTPYSYLLRDLH